MYAYKYVYADECMCECVSEVEEKKSKGIVDSEKKGKIDLMAYLVTK